MFFGIFSYLSCGRISHFKDKLCMEIREIRMLHRVNLTSSRTMLAPDCHMSFSPLKTVLFMTSKCFFFHTVLLEISYNLIFAFLPGGQEGETRTALSQPLPSEMNQQTNERILPPSEGQNSGSSSCSDYSFI